MGKILVLGNNEKITWKDNIENAEFLQMPDFSLGEDGETKLCQFIIDNFSEEITSCAIDVDCISNPELCLAFAMTLRLSIFELKNTALIPILFVSNTTQYIYHGFKFSPIILTGAIAFEKPENAAEVLEIMQPMSSSEFKRSFLDVIKIQPNAAEGRHSIANQWGADVLNRIIVGESTINPLNHKSSRSLYFRYVQALTLKPEDIDSLAKGNNILKTMERIEKIDATGKNILLIDDEADKGWSDVFKNLLKGSSLISICEMTPDYQSLSSFAKNEIENGNYDLIFLDLRMNGIVEEEKLNPMDFSGIKILKSIKEINKGTQVIILTASNKAWNMKALMDAGADGYYIKESPEYAFKNSYSLSNAYDLVDTIKRCLNNGYLRNVYLKIKSIKNIIRESMIYGERTEEVLSGIDIAYDLLAKSDNRNEYKAYSFLQLFLAIEEYVKLPSVIDSSDTGLYIYNGDKRYRILKDKVETESNVSYDSKISMVNGHYRINDGKYINRYFDTNFLVSAILIYKFSQENSAAMGWTKIYKARNEKAAHPKSSNVSVDDFDRILNFMLYFFDKKNNKWRDPHQAFDDIKYEDHLKLLQDKFN